MAKVIESQIVKISKEALYLKGKKAKELDKLARDGLREYKRGKCETIKSLADLD